MFRRVKEIYDFNNYTSKGNQKRHFCHGSHIENLTYLQGSVCMDRGIISLLLIAGGSDLSLIKSPSFIFLTTGPSFGQIMDHLTYIYHLKLWNFGTIWFVITILYNIQLVMSVMLYCVTG